MTGQIALFHRFNHCKASGGKSPMAADQQPPSALTLREDLRTRLGSGLIYRLGLSDNEKMTALSAQAESRALKLPTQDH